MDEINGYRLEFARWQKMCAEHVKALEKLPSPPILLNYARARYLNLNQKEWEAYGNGWFETAFEEWEKKGLEIAREVPPKERAVTLTKLLSTLLCLEKNEQDLTSATWQIHNKFLNELETPKFATVCARGDASGEMMGCCSLLAKGILRSKIPFTAEQLIELINITNNAIGFQSAYPLAAENYPFSAVIRNVAKLPVASLHDLQPNLQTLVTSIHMLPVGDTVSLKEREKLISLVNDLLIPG